MSNLGVILICFAFGWASKRLKLMPPNSPLVLNRFVIYLTLPAITLNLLHRLITHPGASVGVVSIALPVMMAWILFGVSAGFFRLLGSRLGWSRGTIGAVTLTAGLGNTSFVGFPLIEAFYGKAALTTGVLADQPGTFLVLSTLGIFTAAKYSGRQAGFFESLRRLLLFPTVLAGMLAVMLMGVEFPPAFTEILEKIGASLLPIALYSVGMQFDLNSKRLRSEYKPLSLALLYKLVFGPGVIALLYLGLLGVRGTEVHVTIFEAAMGPMISAGIIATEYNIEPELASLIIAVGVAASLITAPLWWAVLK